MSKENKVKQLDGYAFKIDGKPRMLSVIEPTSNVDKNQHYVLGVKKLNNSTNIDTGELRDTITPIKMFKGVLDIKEYKDDKTTYVFIELGCSPSDKINKHFKDFIEFRQE